MKWFESGGYGHVSVIADILDETGQPTGERGRVGACGRPFNDEPGKEAKSLTERPYGGDSCPTCHGRLKRWAADPSTAPEGLEPPEPVAPRRMSAADRAAAIAGNASPLTPDGVNPPGRALAPVRRVSAQDDIALAPGDDVEFPAEDGGMPVVGGALFVVPEAKPRGRRSKAAADEDFSDIDN